MISGEYQSICYFTWHEEGWHPFGGTVIAPCSLRAPVGLAAPLRADPIGTENSCRNFRAQGTAAHPAGVMLYYYRKESPFLPNILNVSKKGEKNEDLCR
jgi:hypothetical protein